MATHEVFKASFSFVHPHTSEGTDTYTSAVINTAVRADCAQARASLPLVAQTQ